MIDIILLPNSDFNIQNILLMLGKYRLSNINKIYTPIKIIDIQVNQEVISEKDQKSFLKKSLSGIENDFLIFNDYSSDYQNVSYLTDQLVFQTSQATKSLLALNSPYSQICYEINDLSDVKTNELIQKIESANEVERSNKITNVNNTIFSLKIFRELSGFDFDYENYEQMHFDYNYKVIDANYKNVILQNRIIPQKFIPKKLFEYDVQRRNKKVLDKWSNKYLGYEPIYYSNQDLNMLLRKKIELNQIKQSQGNILKIVPSDVFTNGLNEHVNDIIKNLLEYNIYCLVPTYSINEVKFFEIVHYYNGNLIERIRLPYSDSMHISNTSSEEYAFMIESIIKNLEIDLVHVHIAGVGHTLDAPKVAKKLGKKVIVSLHDLYYISGDFTQKNPELKFNANQLKEKYSIEKAEKFNQSWRVAVQNFFDNTDEVIAFSSSYPEIYQQHYDIKNIKIIEHGYKFDKKYKIGNPNIDNKPLKIVYFGRVEEEKGSEILKSIATAKSHNIELHILGTIDDKWFAKKVGKKGPKLYVYGKYDRNKLPILLEKIQPHIALIPSIWDEAFAYTLTEAIIYGILPVVSNRGALGARIRDYAIGYSFDPSSTNDLFRIINNIEQMNSLDWKRELQKLNNCHVTTMTEMIENYDRLYRENNSLFS